MSRPGKYPLRFINMKGDLMEIYKINELVGLYAGRIFSLAVVSRSKSHSLGNGIGYLGLGGGVIYSSRL